MEEIKQDVDDYIDNFYNSEAITFVPRLHENGQILPQELRLTRLTLYPYVRAAIGVNFSAQSIWYYLDLQL